MPLHYEIERRHSKNAMGVKQEMYKTANIDTIVIATQKLPGIEIKERYNDLKRYIHID